MRRRSRGSWWVLLACLVVAGLIRAAIPQYLPEEYEVRPDADGRAVTTFVTAEMLDVAQADAVRVITPWADEDVTTPHTLVVARVALTAHERTLFPVAELRTRDGHTYSFLRAGPLMGSGVTHVGTTLSTTFVFEVPTDRVEGAWLAIQAQSYDGLTPVLPVARFDLPDLEVQPRVEFLDDLVEPAR